MADVETDLRIRVLGPVRAWRGEDELELGSAHRRAVLAVLALSAGHPVSRHELIDAVWGEAPPASANGSIYTYVSGLRRIIDPELAPRSGAGVLASTGPGYTLRLGRDHVDVHEFDVRRSSAAQRRAAGDVPGALAELDAALALYRGEPLAGVPGPYAQTQRVRLTELRLTAVEDRAELLLELSRYDELVGELTVLCREHPLREKLPALLMRALHDSGRTAEALAVYETTAATLGELSGIDPGPELRRLHEQLLRSLPTPIRRPELFVGREAELKLLRTAVDGVLAGRGGMVWIEGAPGIGKTSLLAEALHDNTAKLLWAAADEVDRETPTRLLNATVSETLTPEQAVASVTRLCAQGPLIVVADNFQWADELPVRVWHRLGELTDQLPLLLIAACRPMQGKVHSGLVIGLGPLTADDAVLLAARQLGEPLSIQHRQAVGAGAGHPGYLRAIATDLAGPGKERCPSRELTAWLNDQLSSLSEPTRALLQRAALLGTTFSKAELDGPNADQLIEEAQQFGVLTASGETVCFQQPVVRTALYEHAPQAMRVALHHEYAEKLARSGADAVRVAEQLAAALPAVAPWAQDWVQVHIGTVAAERPGIAIDLLRSGSARPDTQLTAMLARLLFWQGWDPRPEASAVLARTSEPDLSAEMRWVLAYVNHRLGRIEEALEQVTEALNDEQVRELWLSRHQRLLERLADEPRAWHLTQALAWGDVRPRSGAPVIAGFQFLDDETAAEIGTPDLLDADAVWRMAPYRAMPGDLHRLLSGQHYWAGNWRGTVAEAEVLLTSDVSRPSYLSPDSAGFSHGSVALIDAHRGDWDAAAEHEQLAADTYARYGDSHQVLLMTQSMRAEWSGQLEQATDLLWPAVSGLTLWSRWLPRVIALALWGGSTAQVERVRNLLVSLPSEHLSPDQEAVREYCLGLIEADADRVHAAAVQLRNAEGLTLLASHAAADHACLLSKQGRAEEADRALDDAVRRYRTIGAVSDIWRLRTRMQALTSAGSECGHADQR
ncbi:BTAD domain-containing putative transcriptional regulator [Kribbella sp. NPDC051587]|uniref:BTAD domain-containing putative transcriptional regulator n=1 Tax=Kribbella sp. NPDC051587 TaxID=3364119 RepID=UPI0037918D02